MGEPNQIIIKRGNIIINNTLQKCKHQIGFKIPDSHDFYILPCKAFNVNFHKKNIIPSPPPPPPPSEIFDL